MKRLLSIALAFILIFSLLSCSQTTESDEEIRTITEGLIKKSVILNEIYWGAGIDTVEGGEKTSDGKYTLADMTDFAEYGISDAETLKEYTRGVYSENECDNIFKNYLSHSAYSDSFGGLMYTEIINRYISDANGRLFVYEDFVDFLNGSVVEYDFSSIKITERERKTVTLEISVTVKNGADPVGYADTLTLEIRKENGEYRLNTPTYCVYDR